MKKTGNKSTAMESLGYIIERAHRNKERIQEQANEAEKQYPLLVFTFKVVLSYAGFLERHARVLSSYSSRNKGFHELSPIYEIDEICPPLPEPLPLPDWIQEIFEIMEAEEYYGKDPGKEPGFKGIPPRTCIDIRADYQNALNCVTEFSQRESLTSEELEEWRICTEDLLRYLNELFENDCLT